MQILVVVLLEELVDLLLVDLLVVDHLLLCLHHHLWLPRLLRHCLLVEVHLVWLFVQSSESLSWWTWQSLFLSL